MPRELAALSASGGTALALDDAGHLVIVGPGEPQPVEEALPALLPALERPRSVFLRDVQQRARAAGLSGDEVWTSIPEEDLLLLGLRMSPYWATHALRWIAETEPTAPIVAALEDLARAGATQRVRHDAKHVLAGRTPEG